MKILIINAGSSSIKYKVYNHENSTTRTICAGLIEGIGETLCQWLHVGTKKTAHFETHKDAFEHLQQALKQTLGTNNIDGVGHRVVHGGPTFYQPTIITNNVIEAIKKLNHLAPLHNPVNILGIEFAQQYFPKATHVAVFDTGFHHTIPHYVSNYAIEPKLAQDNAIKRYGFHGINHEFVAAKASSFLNKDPADCNFISLHLGNGASACLIQKGKSFDTSMGMTPLAGLIMGTRSGDIDPGIILYLIKQGYSPEAIDAALNKNGGLKGLTGANDMRRILAQVSVGDAQASLAIQMYIYRLQKYIGAYYGQAPYLDGLIFTGGIGENAVYIRERTLQNLTHLGFYLSEQRNNDCTDSGCQLINKPSTTPIFVIKGDEESLIAEKVIPFLAL